MRVLFFGPPGAGKGTQATLVNKEMQIPVLTTGSMLRDAVARGDEIGKKAEDFMKQGLLVPDEVVINIILQRLSLQDCLDNGFILDGFPRTTKQAEVLSEHLLQKNMPLDKVIYFFVPDEIVKKRIMEREDGRAEDKDEKITEKRLNVYKKQTQPLIDFYQEKKLLIKIDANRAINEVLEETLKHLQSN